MEDLGYTKPCAWKEQSVINTVLRKLRPVHRCLHGPSGYVACLWESRDIRPGPGSLLAGEIRGSFTEQVASESERTSRWRELCGQRTRRVSTGNVLGKAGMGLAWHQGMTEPGRRRESGQGMLLVPDSQRLSLAEELELHRGSLTHHEWVGWRLTADGWPSFWFPLNTSPCAHS